MKEIRSLSTTTTTAYTVASEDVLVFEAQLSRALSVLAPIADHILLAVQGPGGSSSRRNDSANKTTPNGHRGAGNDDDEDLAQSMDAATSTQEQDHIRADLEYVSEELSALLRAELRGMKWPEDI